MSDAHLEDGRDSGASRVWLVALLLVALVLRLSNAWTASLQLDDFHSLFHARARGLAELFRGLLQDNHPPLSFLVLHAVRAALGEVELVLRSPGILYGLGTVLVVWHLARRLPGELAQVVATACVAVSSLHVEISSDLRMYSLLALAVAGWLDALVDLLEEGRGRLRAVLWGVVGLHTHYHFLYVLAVSGTLVAGLVLFASAYAARRRAAFAVLLWTLGLALPWYVLGFPHQLSHELLPGGHVVSELRLAEGMLHLVFLNVGLAGSGWRVLFLAAGGVLLLAALARGLLYVRPAPGRGPDALGLLCFGIAWVLPTLTALAAALSRRAGFEWRYLAGALPALALLVGAAVAPGRLSSLRRVPVLLALVAALGLSVLNARDPGREDYRDAVRRILAEARPEDAVLPADWSPRIFPHGLAWSYYAPRLARSTTLPARLDHTDEFALAPEIDLRRYPRVFCMFRSIPAGTAMMARLRAAFPDETTEVFGGAIYVVTFSRATGG